MKHSHFLSCLLLVFFPSFSQGQDNLTATVVGDLPTRIEGTSSLFFFDGKLWSCNDHGPLVLYALDTLNAEIIDSVVLQGLVYDMEEVTQDDEYFYLGDFGDNNGVRSDLHVLRLSKENLVSGNVVFDTIWFSYPDRSSDNARDFDCEAFVTTDTALLLFTKQWASLGSGCYTIPKEPGRWEARKLFDLDTRGLVTGACYTRDGGRLVLCGYDMLCSPFIFVVKGFSCSDSVPGQEVRVGLTNGMGCQTEGIASIDGLHYFLTCERLEAYGLTHPAQLLTLDLVELFNDNLDIEDARDSVLDMPVSIYPNPTTGYLHIPAKGMRTVSVFDMQGRLLMRESVTTDSLALDIRALCSASYVLHIMYDDGRTDALFIIKH